MHSPFYLPLYLTHLDKKHQYPYPPFMANTRPLSPELKRRLVTLSQRGIELNEPELWVYSRCFDEPMCAEELGKERGTSTRAIYPYLRVLKRLNLIAPVHMNSRDYWQATLDLRESTDLYLRFLYKDTSFVLPQAAWYLQEPSDIKYVHMIVRSALAHLWDRAKDAANGEKPQAPSGPEIKSMLMNISKTVLEFHEFLQQIIKSEQLWEKPSQAMFESFAGDAASEKTLDFLDYSAKTFRKAWNDVISPRGFKGKPEFLDPEAIQQTNFHHWDNPNDPGKYADADS